VEYRQLGRSGLNVSVAAPQARQAAAEWRFDGPELAAIDEL
jgi:hypothetical protein